MHHSLINLQRSRSLHSLIVGLLLFIPTVTNAEEQKQPNFVIIFTDDQGYQDVGCFGSPLIATPRLDEMAKQGRKFTSFYAQTVCGPSRAALMTGCYPLRTAKARQPVTVHPYLHSKEITIAEVLKPLGYKTAAFGKWDLAGHSQTSMTQRKAGGYDPALLPLHQGFDYFFGTPTSNDSVVNIIRNNEMIEKKADMGLVTRRYTDEAIKFIEENHNDPFFVYLAHSMPHTRLGASADFKGKSKRGMYGDVIEEIDFNVGRILDTINKLKLQDETYVFFFSDNGPWHIKKEHGGSALPLRGAKTSTWEGGLRVPCIMWAPGRIPADTSCDELTATFDMLPTLANIAGTKAPQDRILDGHNISDLIHGVDGATTQKEAFYYYQHTHLQAVRSGKWKLHVTRPGEPPWGPKWANHIDKANDVFDIKTPLLYNLETDIGETTNVASQNPEVVKRLLKLIEQGRHDIGDYNRKGDGIRHFEAFDPRPDVEQWK
ncbi:MAG: sulfatase family protein [Pirellulales bacterium]